VQRRSKIWNLKLALPLAAVAVVAATGVSAATASADATNHAAPTPTIVLEHGAWADGSSWGTVVSRLQNDGYTVDVPPNPLRGPAADSAYLASYLATIKGPIVLVGHSYGGFVISDAATGNTNVKALVYVDAYIPAQGDALNSLTEQFPGGEVTPSALNFVPSSGGVVDAYIKPDCSTPSSPTICPPSEQPNSPRFSDPSPARHWANPPVGRPGPTSRAGTSSAQPTTRFPLLPRSSWPSARTLSSPRSTHRIPR
jgi:pimeloyl-ACP methyl ester carboxylesterase